MGYNDLIWTNHARDRMHERGIREDMVFATINHPDTTTQERDAVRYLKQHGNYRVTAVVKKNERNELVILSCWMDPPLPGTKDERKKEQYRAYQKASPLMKFLLTFKKQLGF